MSSSTPTTTTRPQKPAQVPALRVKTRIRAGGFPIQHNETRVRPSRPVEAGLKIKTRIQAGGIPWNHNETRVRPSAR